MSEQNKIIIRRLFNEGMNQKKLYLIDEIIGASYINHDMPGTERGPAGFKKLVQSFTDGFADMHIHLSEVIAEGDIVVTRGEWTGTHTGDFMGMPATGKKIKIKYIDMWRMENEKAVENWVQMDMSSLMQQLGMMPAQV